MPDTLKLPRMLRAVIPLMRGERLGRGVIRELIAFALGRAGGSGLAGRRSRLMPGFAAIVGTLNDLPEPAAGLRGVNSIRINWRSLHVVNFPARKVGAADVPLFALAVRRQDKCAFAGSNQYSYFAHRCSPSLVSIQLRCDPMSVRIHRRSRAVR